MPGRPSLRTPAMTALRRSDRKASNGPSVIPSTLPTAPKVASDPQTGVRPARRPQRGVCMGKRFAGTINIDGRDSTPDWEPYLQPVAPAGAPSVLYIVLDDVGFSAMEPWGGLIETPHINKLAETGLTYTNWHTTALCSPTRSSLLTGRNHTTNGM